MAVGTSTYKGLAVPLNGEVELRQDTAATDFITLTGDASISGDYLVCRTGSTEVFVINSAGAIAAGSITTGVGVAGVRLETPKTLKVSTPPTPAPPPTPRRRDNASFGRRSIIGIRTRGLRRIVLYHQIEARRRAQVPVAHARRHRPYRTLRWEEHTSGLQ